MLIVNLSFSKSGETSGFLSDSYFTHGWVVCFYSNVLFGISTVQVRSFTLWREGRRNQTGGRRDFQAALTPSVGFWFYFSCWWASPLLGIWKAIDVLLPGVSSHVILWSFRLKRHLAVRLTSFRTNTPSEQAAVMNRFWLERKSAAPTAQRVLVLWFSPKRNRSQCSVPVPGAGRYG